MCRQVVDKFVDRVIIKKDTIEVTFNVSVVSIGGGGPHVHVYTDIKDTFFCLSYSDPRNVCT